MSIFIRGTLNPNKILKVDLMHYQPETLNPTFLQSGYIIDNVPTVDSSKIGKSAVLFYNIETKDMWYEYEEAPLSPLDQATKDLEELKSQNAQMLLALVEGGLM